MSIGMGIQGTNPTFFPGLLADVRIYDEALDEAAIRAIMAGEGLEARLQAGDANMDLTFDQLDLVKVQIAAKYLTGQSATWGEGDWDGAPGGAPGDPPPGNGLFDQLDIIAALGAGTYLTGPYGALRPDGGETTSSMEPGFAGSLAREELAGEIQLVYVPEPGTSALLIIAIILCALPRWRM